MKFNPKVTLQKIPDGPEGVHQTLKLMRRLVLNGRKDFSIRRLAARLVENRDSKDFVGEVKDLHRYVRDRIRYLKDIREIETVATPVRTLEFGQGDCDDKAVLLAALLEAIGHRTRFVAIGFDPNHFEHVLVETKIANHWVALETTEPVEMGWYPPGVRARMEVHI